MVKVQQLKNGQMMVTIPQALATAKGIIKGCECDWLIDRGDLVLRIK